MKVKRFFAKLMALCVIFALSSYIVMAASDDSWDGTTLTEPQVNDDGAYVVTSASELAWIANASNQGAAYTHDIVLANDIDLGGRNWTPIARDATTTKFYFAGNIDGQGHTIKGFHIEANDADNASIGFIGAVGGTAAKTAVIKNLTLEGDIVVENGKNADIGSLIGFANDLAAIENCHSKVNITYKAGGNYLGGLVGRLKATDIKNSSYSGTLTLTEDATMTNGWGGLLGSFNSSTKNLTASVSECLFAGVINSKATASMKYGAALVGYSNLSKGTVDITKNLAKGSMTVATKPANYGIWFGKAAGTVNTTENYTDHFTLDGEEQTTNPNPDPDPKPDPDPDPEPSDGITRVLCIGNSFTVDAVEDYLSPICRSVGKKVIIGYPYKGGTTLEQHMGYINTKNAIYNYRKIDEEGTHTAQPNSIFDVALKDEKWDYVVIQTDHNYSGVYSHYFPYLTDLMNYVKANGQNPNPKFFLYMTWAYDASSTYKDFPLYGNDQMTMYNAIIDCAYRAAAQAGIETVVPAGTAVQNCRTTYIGQNMNRDGYHMNFEYGRYVVGLTYAATVLGIDPQTVTYHPETISDNLAQLCKDAVTAALANPKEITSLADKWGVNPDVKNEPLPRKINISLQPERTNELMGSQWNIVDATDITCSVENLIDEAYVPTAVRVSVNKAFTAEEPGSLLLTGMFHGQTYDIQLHYMLNGEPATITQKDIAPDVNGRIYIDAETASAAGDGIDGLYEIVIEPKLQYTDAEGNTAVLDPTSGIPTRTEPGTPWDGEAKSEPAKGAGNCYIINAAAELAWVAGISNDANTDANMLIAHDIDLGGYKWTPIGQAKNYNGTILGGGHTIKGLYLEPAAADLNCGLIGQTNGTGTIKDLNVEGRMLIKQLPTGKNADYGTIIGLANALKTLQNCHSKVDIVGEGGCGIYQGGLVGRMKGTAIDRCSYNGNMTIAATNSKTKGYGGLVGTANSSVEGIEGSITNSYVTGNVTNSSDGESLYGGGIIGYANLVKGTFTVSNCYVGGAFTQTGTKPENYGYIVGKATDEGEHTVVGLNYALNAPATDSHAVKLTEEDLHDGALCYTLNLAAGENRIFGQNLAEENSFPVIYVDGQDVYRTIYIVDEADYAILFNNHRFIFPAEPVKEGYIFLGWFDAATGGNSVSAETETDSDMNLYAQFDLVNAINTVAEDVTATTYYTLEGKTAPATYRGIVVGNGKKYVRK